MDVVEATGIPVAEKRSILKAWEVDERALQRAEDEGMGGGEHSHLQRCRRRSAGWRKRTLGWEVDYQVDGAEKVKVDEAIAEGLRHLGFKNDHEIIATDSIVYDAHYGYKMVRRGKPTVGSADRHPRRGRVAP
jgi:hypothetical protein